MYEVQYKHINATKWTKISNVTADGILSETRTRFFMDEDNIRYEVPTKDVVFKFSAERHEMIASKAEKSNQ